jgi:hypothetical protein
MRATEHQTELMQGDRVLVIRLDVQDVSSKGSQNPTPSELVSS